MYENGAKGKQNYQKQIKSEANHKGKFSWQTTTVSGKFYMQRQIDQLLNNSKSMGELYYFNRLPWSFLDC